MACGQAPRRVQARTGATLARGQAKNAVMQAGLSRCASVTVLRLAWLATTTVMMQEVALSE